MNVEIGTVVVQFLFWEYLFPIFGIGSMQCSASSYTCAKKKNAYAEFQCGKSATSNLNFFLLSVQGDY